MLKLNKRSDLAKPEIQSWAKDKGLEPVQTRLILGMLTQTGVI